MSKRTRAPARSGGLDAVAATAAVAAVLAQDGTAPRAARAGQAGQAGQALTVLGAMVQDMAADGHRRQDPIRAVFARVGDRWSVLLLLVLRAGEFRHATLRRLVGAVAAEGEISQRMLTLRLRDLERDGLIARRILPGKPPGVSYGLTVLGSGLLTQVDALMAWTRAHGAQIRAARARYLAVAARPGAPQVL